MLPIGLSDCQYGLALILPKSLNVLKIACNRDMSAIKEINFKEEFSLLMPA